MSIDYTKITAEMHARIINDPMEASGCIQSLVETVSRQNLMVEFMEDCSDSLVEENKRINDENGRFYVNYIFAPWYKRIWNAWRRTC